MTIIDINTLMQIMLVVWVVLSFRIVRQTIAEGSVGLPASFILAMSFLYGGCFVYAVPGYTHLRFDGNPVLLRYAFTEWTVIRGTFASLLGVLGFAIGAGVFRRRRHLTTPPLKSRSPNVRRAERRIVLILGGFGIWGFAVHYLNLNFLMSSALNEFGRNVGISAICVGTFLAWRSRKPLWPWVALASMVPLYYLVLFGFASYGFLFGAILASFVLAILGYRSVRGFLRTAILVIVGMWTLLTLFVGWFSFRDQIRDVVWEGEEGSVWSILGQAFAKTEIFSPWNFASLDLINIRLNLPIFIGKMIEYHTQFPDLREYGATIAILPLVVAPRFLWPNKPERGGSELMTQHTGLGLSENATFGTGTVFEFYINFGYIGVLVGFIVLGWIIRRFDRAAYRHLMQGRLFDFARLFVVGLVAIDPLLRPFFIVNGAVFAWILMTALKMAFPQSLARPRRRLRTNMNNAPEPRLRS